MSNSRDSLEKLIHFVKEIANVPGNEWFKKEISIEFSPQSQILEFDDYNNDSIRKIYEYCLREIVRTQAQKFYENFVCQEIRDQLVKDFIRMEHYRRQDDFENFCLALFQQLEGIVNYLTSSEVLNTHVMQKRGESVLTRTDQNKKKHLTGPSLDEFLAVQKKHIDELFSRHINKWFFNNKLRVVLFFYCFNGEMFGMREFNRMYDTGNYIYQVRNLNHRGGIKTNYQVEILEKILPTPHKFQLGFLGYLEEFVKRIQESTFTTGPGL